MLPFVPPTGFRIPQAAVGGGPPAESHRYWQFEMTGNYGGGVHALSEFKGFENVGDSVNALAGATVTASSTFGGFSANNLFDGNSMTSWAATSAGTETLKFDLGIGVSKTIREIYWLARGDGSGEQIPVTGRWRYSDDGVTWTTYFSFTKVPLKNYNVLADMNCRIRHPNTLPTVGAGLHRFWGIRGNVSPGAPYMSPTEIQLRATIGGANMANVGANWKAIYLYPGFNPVNLVDGNTATEVSTQIVPSWWIYDFGEGNEKAKPAQLAITDFAGFPTRMFTDFDLVYFDRLGDALTVQQNYPSVTWPGPHPQTQLFTVT